MVIPLARSSSARSGSLPARRGVADVRFDVGTWTVRGRRWPSNADALASQVPTDIRLRSAMGAFFAVADAPPAANRRPASRIAVERAATAFYRAGAPDPVSGLLHAVRAANREVGQYGATGGSRCFSTLVAAAVQPGRAVIVSVGDSRAYLFRESLLWRITRDHTVRGEAYTDGGRLALATNPNALTRAIGAHSEVRVDLTEVPLRPGDTLLLCTDGLTDVVGEPHLARVLQQHPPAVAARELALSACRLGGGDNVTVVVVRAWPAGAPRTPDSRPIAPALGTAPAALPAPRPALVPLLEVTGGMLGATGVIALMLSLIVR